MGDGYVMKDDLGAGFGDLETTLAARDVAQYLVHDDLGVGVVRVGVVRVGVR